MVKGIFKQLRLNPIPGGDCCLDQTFIRIKECTIYPIKNFPSVFKLYRISNSNKTVLIPYSHGNRTVLIPYSHGNRTVLIPYSHGNRTVHRGKRKGDEVGRRISEVEVWTFFIFQFRGREPNLHTGRFSGFNVQIRISSTLFTPTHFSFSEPIPRLRPYPSLRYFSLFQPYPTDPCAEKEQRDERKAKNVTRQINAFYCSPSLPTPPWAMMFALLKIIRFRNIICSREPEPRGQDG